MGIFTFLKQSLESKHLRPSYTAESLRYFTLYDEALLSVKVEHVIREKNKEPVYRILLIDVQHRGVVGRKELSETKYKQYIGDEVNAIRARYAKVFFILFTVGSRPNLVFFVDRELFPWDEDTIEFPGETLIHIGNSILKHPDLAEWRDNAYISLRGVTHFGCDYSSPEFLQRHRWDLKSFQELMDSQNS